MDGGSNIIIVNFYGFAGTQRNKPQSTANMARDDGKGTVALGGDNAIDGDTTGQSNENFVEGGVPHPPQEAEKGEIDAEVVDVVDGEGIAKKENNGFMKAAKSEALRPFVIISSSYLLFTITDGAIRMIVLQHAYNKSFSAMQVAIMFTLYELAGVFTNLVRPFVLAIICSPAKHFFPHPTFFLVILSRLLVSWEPSGELNSP